MRTKLVCNRYFPDPPGIVSAVVVEAQTKAPLAKGGCLGTAEAGGFPRVAGVHIGLYFRRGFPRVAGVHIGLYFRKVPTVRSLSHASGVPAPFGKGAFAASAR